MGKSKVDEMLNVIVVKSMSSTAYDEYNKIGKLDDHIESEKNVLMRQMQCQSLKNVLMRNFERHWQTLIDEGDADEIIPILKEMKEKKDDKFKSDYLFITINPSPNVSIIEFLKLLPRIDKKVWIKQYLYVIEQRSENLAELGKGFHLHLLINKGDFRFSHASREFVTLFKGICDTSNHQIFNISMCKECDLKKRQNYMLARKADPAKWLKQDMDIEFRKKYNIPAYYGNKFFEDDAEM